MNYIGIDIGSTAAKVTVFSDKALVDNYALPTGWSSVETAKAIKTRLEKGGVDLSSSKVVATGYGRISVPYADKTVTEITCHGAGTTYLFGKNATVIDIGGQDTKIITLVDGKVADFVMNDKCAAGTGKFLELMSNTLGVGIEELARMALEGENIAITSMCTVFAESEVISLIGAGTKRESIARGIVNSITGRVYALLHKHGAKDPVFLTGGLCEIEPFVHLLSEKFGTPVKTNSMARYAGSIGAALIARKI